MTVVDLSRAPVLDARHLGKEYSSECGDPVLRDVSFTVHAGEIVGLRGPSGCGKSTLLRLLMTVERPTSGELRFDGDIVSRARRDGFVMPIFQNAHTSLDPRWPIWKSITEPLMAPHRAKRPGGNERRRLATEQCERVGLDSVDISARPRHLSGGQCQRLAIIRALIAQPRLIIADEPTSALDVSVAAGVLHLLAEVASKGVAIVVASHDHHALGALCGRILTLSDGTIVDSGASEASPLPEAVAT